MITGTGKDSAPPMIATQPTTDRLINLIWSKIYSAPGIYEPCEGYGFGQAPAENMSIRTRGHYQGSEQTLLCEVHPDWIIKHDTDQYGDPETYLLGPDGEVYANDCEFGANDAIRNGAILRYSDPVLGVWHPGSELVVDA